MATKTKVTQETTLSQALASIPPLHTQADRLTFYTGLIAGELLPEELSERLIALGNQWLGKEAEQSQQPKASKATLSTADMVAKFLESKRNDLAKDSYEKYLGSLKTFAKEHPYLPLTPEPIESFLAARPASSSKRYYYALLSPLYKFAHERMGVPNVIAGIKRPRKGKSKESDYATLEHLRVLLDAIGADDRLRGMVYVMVGQGFRRSELCRANVADIADDKIRVHGKEAEEWMPLVAEVREALLKQAGGRTGDEPLFVSTTTGKRLSAESINKIVKALFERAGIKSIRPSPHTLRHTFGTLMQAHGCDRYSAELLLRHRTPNTTDIYTHLTTEQRLNLLRPKLEQFCPLRLVNGAKPITGNLL